MSSISKKVYIVIVKGKFSTKPISGEYLKTKYTIQMQSPYKWRLSVEGHDPISFPAGTDKMVREAIKTFIKAISAT